MWSGWTLHEAPGELGVVAAVAVGGSSLQSWLQMAHDMARAATDVLICPSAEYSLEGSWWSCPPPSLITVVFLGLKNGCRPPWKHPPSCSIQGQIIWNNVYCTVYVTMPGPKIRPVPPTQSVTIPTGCTVNVLPCSEKLYSFYFFLPYHRRAMLSWPRQPVTAALRTGAALARWQPGPEDNNGQGNKEPQEPEPGHQDSTP